MTGEDVDTTPREVLGDTVYDAFVKAGVDRFVIWREMDTAGKFM